MKMLETLTIEYDTKLPELKANCRFGQMDGESREIMLEARS
jgi:hypothetical protein